MASDFNKMRIVDMVVFTGVNHRVVRTWLKEYWSGGWSYNNLTKQFTCGGVTFGKGGGLARDSAGNCAAFEKLEVGADYKRKFCL